MAELIKQKLSDSKAYRWAAMILVSFTVMCSCFVYDLAAPLQGMLQQTFGWSTTEYGIFSSSGAFFNVFFLALIFGGIFLDRTGIHITGAICFLLMLTGVLIKACALSEWFPAQGRIFGLNSRLLTASLGFAIFGMGAETCFVTLQKAVVKWFSGHELALAMGLQISIGRMGSACALSFGLPIASFFGSISSVVWIGLMLIAMGTLSFFVFCVMDRREDLYAAGVKAADAGKKEKFKTSDIKLLITNKGFLLISVLCLLFYSGIFPFLKYATRLMIYKYHVPENLAGAIPSILPFGSILLIPVFCRIYDSRGKGATLLIIGSLMLTAVHALLSIPFLNEWWFAVLLMVFLGISSSLVPSAMWPSIAKIVDQRRLGTAYALVFYFQNLGMMAVTILIGGAIDRFGRLPGDVPAYDYTIPLLIFAFLGLMSVLIALWLKKIDKQEGYGLEKPNLTKN